MSRPIKQLESNELPADLQPKVNYRAEIFKLIKTNKKMSNNELIQAIMINPRSIRRILEELTGLGYIKYTKCDCYTACPIRIYEVV